MAKIFGGSASRLEVYALFVAAVVLIGGGISGAVVLTSSDSKPAIVEQSSVEASSVPTSISEPLAGDNSATPTGEAAFQSPSSNTAQTPNGFRQDSVEPQSGQFGTSTTTTASAPQVPATQPPSTQPACAPNQAELARLQREFDPLNDIGYSYQWDPRFAWGNNVKAVNEVWAYNQREYNRAKAALQICQFAYWQFRQIPPYNIR